MITLKADLTIASITPMQEIQRRDGGRPFFKREMVLKDEWEDRNHDIRYTLLSVEVKGDLTQYIDSFNPGDNVKIAANVQGREYNGRVFNTITLTSIAPVNDNDPRAIF